MAHRLPALVTCEVGIPGAWWLLRWDGELLTFTAEMVVDHSGEQPCSEAPADSDDCYDSEEGPLVVLGLSPGELGEVAELEAAMRWEDEPVCIPAAMAAELVAERDRFVATFGRDEIRARVDAAWKASDERSERLRASQL
jgi:hypothetical protein